jgi:hypothetical protein
MLEHPDPPWPIFDRFKERIHLNPVVQFKHVNQTTTITEYIREFQRAKSRLLVQIGIKNEYHYVWNFIGD